MWNHKYGDFSDSQVKSTKEWMRKQIFFLLLCGDPNTKDDYKHININQAFDGILRQLGGLNEVLFCPPEMVKIISLLEAAKSEILKSDFQFSIYRKLILDAGNEVNSIKEV